MKKRHRQAKKTRTVIQVKVKRSVDQFKEDQHIRQRYATKLGRSKTNAKTRITQLDSNH